MSPTARVLAGLAAGAIIGLVLAAWQPGIALEVANVAQPVGKLWLNALQMTVVPLVLALVVIGVLAGVGVVVAGLAFAVCHVCVIHGVLHLDWPRIVAAMHVDAFFAKTR